MSNLAFLVEGKMEQLVVQSLCPGTPVRIINCNGDHVGLEVVGKKVASLALLLERKGHHPIVVVLDREGRGETTKFIKEKLLKLFHDYGVTAPIILGMPDRMIENWILADSYNFVRSANVDESLLASNYEGSCGEVKLKKLLPKGAAYVKTIHGVAWFRSADPDSIAKGSVSFREFAEALKEIRCRWLSEKRLL